jgi:hypothetical protein
MAQSSADNQKQQFAMLATAVLAKLEEGYPQELIVQEFTRKGLPEDATRRFVAQVANLRETSPSQMSTFRRVRKTAIRDRGRVRFIQGLGLLVLGGIVTAGSYVIALPGSTFLICWGAMGLGAIWMVAGLFEWITGD